MSLWGKTPKNENVILTKFSSLAALEVVILTTSSAASDDNFIKWTHYRFSITLLEFSIISHHCLDASSWNLFPRPKWVKWFVTVLMTPHVLHFASWGTLLASINPSIMQREVRPPLRMVIKAREKPFCIIGPLCSQVVVHWNKISSFGHNFSSLAASEILIFYENRVEMKTLPLISVQLQI